MKVENRYMEKIECNGIIFLVYELFMNDRFICLKAVKNDGSYSAYGVNKEILLRNVARYMKLYENQKVR